jgi:hypothetical protein
MKTRWQFYFEAEGIVFDGEYHFAGRIGRPGGSADEADPIEFELQLVSGKSVDVLIQMTQVGCLLLYLQLQKRRNH